MKNANPPDLQPTLAGQTIVIRPIRQEDWRDMFAAASDPLIWQAHPAADRYKENVFREYFDGAVRCGSGFAFVERSTGRIVGSSRYHGHHPERSEIEIGWTFLVREKWGGATNREIKKLMITHAFTFVDRVVFWVGESNWRSRRAMQKIGALQQGGPVSRTPGGAPHVMFEITKAGFQL
jgi:RimJ/RimL family protein N-acetyltransferase